MTKADGKHGEQVGNYLPLPSSDLKHRDLSAGPTTSYTPQISTSRPHISPHTETSKQDSSLTPQADTYVEGLAAHGAMHILNVHEDESQPGREKGENYVNVDTNTLEKRKTEDNMCNQHDRGRVVSFCRINETNHSQQQKEALSPVCEEPVVLLKPEDFMKKATAQDSSIMHKSSSQHSCSEIMSGKINTKHSCISLNNGSGDQNAHGIDSVFKSYVHAEISTSLRDNPVMLDPDKGDYQETNYHENVDYFDTVASYDSIRKQQVVRPVNVEELSPEEELIRIRDMLKIFTDQKQKLRLVPSHSLSLYVSIHT